MTNKTQVANLKIARNDDLLAAQESLHSIRPPRDRGGLSQGWLDPQTCWALYKQWGVVRQLLTKVANQAVSKGWQWAQDGIGYDWSGVSSDLETLGLQVSLKKGIKWAHVEGGALIVFRLDETQRVAPAGYGIEAQPMNPKFVRGVKAIEVYSATQARPESSKPGHRYWDTCDSFDVKHRDGTVERVHRSRCVPIVVDDIPMGGGVATLYSSTTGWPPSWLDGVVDSLQSWRDAESTTDDLLHTISLLILELDGAREAMTSTDQTERDNFRTLVQGIADNLSSTGVLALPAGDKLGEVGRSTGGADKLLKAKQNTFVSDTGYSRQRVLMEVTTGLGDTSNGPRLDDHETIEGLQESMCTPTINRGTEFVLMGIAHYGGEVPTKWVVVFNALATQSPEEQAKTRETVAKARAADVKAGVPELAVLSDPDLSARYPKLDEILSARALAEEEARAAEAAAGADPTRPRKGEELLSAAEIGRRLGVSAGTILAMRARGSIRGWKIGGRWRFSWQQVQAALGSELGALKGAVGDAARRGLAQLNAGGKIDAATWDAVVPVLLGCRLDALPLGLELSESTEFGSMYGASEAMREVFSVLERVAPTMLPVLILGETGTGKDGAARGLHDVGKRAGPYLAVNCATLGDDAAAIALELLGDGERPGLFEQANGGTLFLDEVGELSEVAQAVLLRALSGDVRRARGAGRQPLEVRVVSATWREIGIAGACKFRRDLYERLAGVVVELPPLRERSDDVLELAARFLVAAAEEMGLDPEPKLGVEARAVLRAHAWPGNIRELLNAIRRAVVFAGSGSVIQPEHLQLHVGRTP
jgi:excisionase family DNA binding protein